MLLRLDFSSTVVDFLDRLVIVHDRMLVPLLNLKRIAIIRYAQCFESSPVQIPNYLATTILASLTLSSYFDYWRFDVLNFFFSLAEFNRTWILWHFFLGSARIGFMIKQICFLNDDLLLRFNIGVTSLNVTNIFFLLKIFGLAVLPQFSSKV